VRWPLDTLFRLGTELVARMPRIDGAADHAETDVRWLPYLAPHLRLRVPAPLALGLPGEGFPWSWSVAPWIPGETPTADNVDLDVAATQLGEFVAAMRTIEPDHGLVKTGTMRGVPLAARDEITRPRSRRSATGSTAAVHWTSGSGRSPRRRGSRRAGCTATSLRATCWFAIGA
jgi:aminoglycoside phosphotransferase (APT) family kinase protein